MAPTGSTDRVLRQSDSDCNAAAYSLERLRGDLLERIKPDARRPIYQTKVWGDTFVSVRQVQDPAPALVRPLHRFVSLDTTGVVIAPSAEKGRTDTKV